MYKNGDAQRSCRRTQFPFSITIIGERLRRPPGRVCSASSFKQSGRDGDGAATAESLTRHIQDERRVQALWTRSGSPETQFEQAGTARSSLHELRLMDRASSSLPATPISPMRRQFRPCKAPHVRTISLLVLTKPPPQSLDHLQTPCGLARSRPIRSRTEKRTKTVTRDRHFQLASHRTAIRPQTRGRWPRGIGVPFWHSTLEQRSSAITVGLFYCCDHRLTAPISHITRLRAVNSFVFLLGWLLKGWLYQPSRIRAEQRRVNRSRISATITADTPGAPALIVLGQFPSLCRY